MQWGWAHKEERLNQTENCSMGCNFSPGVCGKTSAEPGSIPEFRSRVEEQRLSEHRLVACANIHLMMFRGFPQIQESLENTKLVSEAHCCGGSLCHVQRQSPVMCPKNKEEKASVGGDMPMGNCGKFPLRCWKPWLHIGANIINSKIGPRYSGVVITMMR